MKGCESQGDMMEMMSNMMKGCEPEMMTGMMSHCLGMMLPKMPQEARADFVLKMVGTLAERGSADLSPAARNDLSVRLRETLESAFGQSTAA